MPDATTIDDKTWNDLYEADYDLLRELAKRRDGVRGDGSRERICARLLELEGRADEVPDEYSEYLGDEPGQSDVTEADDDSDEQESDDGDDGDEADDEGDEEVEYQAAKDYNPDLDSWIISASVLQDWLEYPRTLVDEARIHINFDGLKLKAVDPATVGMIDTTLSEDAFESFEVLDNGTIGVNLVRFADVVNGAAADDLISISHDTTSRNLVIQYGGHEFTLGLIDPDSIRSEPELPDLDLPATVRVNGGAYSTAVEYAESVSDHVELNANPAPSAFGVHAEGDTDSYDGEWDDGSDEVEFEHVPGEDIRSLYSLDYMTDMVKPLDDDQTVTVTFGQEFPVIMEIDVRNDDAAVGHVTFMLAPRIQSN